MSDLIKHSGPSLTPEDIIVLEESGIIPKGTPKANIEFYSSVCRQTGLSPFKKQIHLVKRRTKHGDAYTIQTAIDGLRAIAERTGRYAGSDDALFDDELSEFQIRKSGKKRPNTATVTIYKLIGGQRVPFTATASWSEYFPSGKNVMWEKMPFTMLSKCAEAKALRKGFPEETSGLYVDEEMHQADAPVQRPKKSVPEVSPEKLKKATSELKALLKEYESAQELANNAQGLIDQYQKKGVADARQLCLDRHTELLKAGENE